ncbi:hypothetical protein [Planctomicrobium sp. SH527]|uniref:hypothetical protein n=1 Tax=Planctomicrobium sp. SH527 TaxID=3448123 RepID=UPI003F5C7E3D
MTAEIDRFLSPEERQLLGVDLMNEEQRQTLLNWGRRMFALGQHVVSEIAAVKYDGRLVILEDGSRWEVEEGDSHISEMWDTFDKVLVINDEMYKLDELEKVEVQEDLD